MARSRGRRFAMVRSHVKPIVIRTTKILKKHARHHYSGGARGLFSGKRIGIVTGAFIVGFIQKSGIQLPEIPLLGEAGTIGLAAYFLSGGGRNKLMDEVATAALTIAAYELGSTGKIVGEEGLDGYVAGY